MYSGRLQHICWNSFYSDTRCIDALCGVRIPFQSLAQSPKGNPDSSPPVQSPVNVYTSHSPIFILRLQKRLVFLLYLALFWLVGLLKRKIIEPSLAAFTGFPFALVFTVHWPFLYYRWLIHPDALVLWLLSATGIKTRRIMLWWRLQLFMKSLGTNDIGARLSRCPFTNLF